MQARILIQRKLLVVGLRNLQIEHASEGSVEVAQAYMQARGHQRTTKAKILPLTARPLPHERDKKDGVARAKQPLAPP